MINVLQAKILDVDKEIFVLQRELRLTQKCFNLLMAKNADIINCITDDEIAALRKKDAEEEIAKMHIYSVEV